MRDNCILHDALTDVDKSDNEIMNMIDSCPNAVQYRNRDGDLPLHIACRRSTNRMHNSQSTICTTSTSSSSEKDDSDELLHSPAIVKKLISLNPRAVMQRSPRDGQRPLKFLFESKHKLSDR